MSAADILPTVNDLTGMSYDWIFIKGSAMTCERCGEQKELSKLPPIAITDLIDVLKGFSMMHKSCKEKTKIFELPDII